MNKPNHSLTGALAVFGVLAMTLVGCIPGTDAVTPDPSGAGGFFPDPNPGSGGNFGCSGEDFGFGGTVVNSGSPVPQLGATITPAVPPPSIAGGTLRVLRDGHTAVASDPDRDGIHVVDLTTAKLLTTVILTKGDEPGRVIEDSAGRVHVSLRRGGAIVTLDPATWTVSARRPVCVAPRGLAHEPKTDSIHVACADGQLVSLPAAGGLPWRTVRLDRDLRDVVVDGDSLLVSRFRSAQVLTVNAAGTVDQWLTPAPFMSFEAHNGGRFSPSVAWRMVEMPGGGAAMVHQRGLDDTVTSQPGGYGGFNPCDSIVHTSVSKVKRGGMSAAAPAMPGMVLATDLALSADGKRIAIIASGNATNASQSGAAPDLPRVFVSDTDRVTDPKVGCRPDGVHSPCMFNGGFGGQFGSGDFGAGGVAGFGGTGGAPGTGGNLIAPSSGAAGSSGAGAAMGAPLPPQSPGTCQSTTPAGGAPEVAGEPIAVAFDGAGSVVVQAREPAALYLASGAKVVLSTELRIDTGHAVFHANAGGGVACASCHPEGADDGRVWNFSCEGKRRTQALDVGIAGTEPFHWNGDMKSFSQLMDTVFVGRMSGPKLSPAQLDATLTWIDRQPRLIAPSPADALAVQRGRTLFNDAAGPGCAACHSGAKFTNNLGADVGTGGIFQVPSLVGVAGRAPFMHNGCAKTLAGRFNASCGGGDKHGVVSRLSQDQIADLIAFMETL